ncbi:MAG: SocA family protein [Enhydrobacter sp.]|nr:MAG: SocA family protein [Enhydrobacter sp.]
MTDLLDPRGICNLMLDEAGGHTGITNLALQKLLYFVHGLHLVETKKPLVSGFFEAWQYGPVHPTAYRAFKTSGDKAITFRATSLDPLSGVPRSIPTPSDGDVIKRVRKVMSFYGGMTPGRLVEISHAFGSPWWYIVQQARVSTAFGLRIPDSVILERFRFHKVSVGVEPAHGEPSEDAPFA